MSPVEGIAEAVEGERRMTATDSVKAESSSNADNSQQKTEAELHLQELRASVEALGRENGELKDELAKTKEEMKSLKTTSQTSDPGHTTSPAPAQRSKACAIL